MPCSSHSSRTPGQVRLRRDEHPVRADDGLEDDGRDLLGTLVLHHLGQVGEGADALLLVRGRPERRAVRVRAHEVDDAGDRRLAPPAPRLAGEGHGGGGGAVVAAVRRQHLRPARVGAGQADGVLVGLGAAVGEEDPVEALGRVGGDEPGRLVAGLVGEGRRDGAEPLGLLDDGGDHLRVLVAEVQVHQLRREVEPAVALVVPELAPGAAGERERVDQVLGRPGVEDVGSVGGSDLGVGGGDGVEDHPPIFAWIACRRHRAARGTHHGHRSRQRSRDRLRRHGR